MRFVAFCLLLLVLIFFGHCLYYRHNTDRLLQKAIAEIKTQPKEAYRILEPVFNSSDFVTLGKITEARNRFEKELVTIGLDTIRKPLPDHNDFIFVRDTLEALRQMKGQLTPDAWREAQVALLRAARDTMPQVRDHGTYTTWEGMIQFYKELDARGGIPDGVFDDFKGWMGQVEAVATRSLGLREAVLTAQDGLQRALSILGMAVAPGQKIAAIPVHLRNDQLRAAQQAFVEARAGLEEFSVRFNLPVISPDLIGMDDVLRFDLAAIKLAHVQDRGVMLQYADSAFIVSLISPQLAGWTNGPSPAEMYQDFMAQTELEFNPEDGGLFETSPLLSASLRHAYRAMVLVNLADLEDAWGHTEEAKAARAAAEGPAFAVGHGEGVAVLEQLRASLRAKLIVALPAPPI